MNLHRPDDDDRSTFDRLEALLTQARWDAPAADRLTRLRHTLSAAVGQQSSARRRRHWAIFGLAASALLALGLGLGIWRAAGIGAGPRHARPTAGEPRRLSPRRSASNVSAGSAASSNESDSDRSPSDLPHPSQSRDTADSPVQAPADRAVAISADSASRTPNTYERLVVAAIERRLPAAVASAPSDPASPSEDAPKTEARPSPVDRAIERLVAEGERGLADEEFAALLAPLYVDRESNERQLVARLADPQAGDRPAVVRLLAEVATPAALKTLRASFAAPATRLAAARGLARLEDTARLMALLGAELDTTARDTLLSGLVERHEEPAVVAMLDLIANPVSAEATLAALAAARHPPIDGLFAVLTGPVADRRALAARALGRIGWPEVTLRLEWLVAQGAYRHDALLALVSSRGAEAERFVALARKDETLTASVAWAERQFAVLFPQQQKRFIP